MKILRSRSVLLVLLLAQLAGYAQPDTLKIKERALFFADSLVKADTYQNWDIYADLAPASVMKYYGGKEGYTEHIRTNHARTVSTLEEDAPMLQFLHLLTQNGQWQCVIQESRYFHRDDKKFHLVTYFVGESKDDGETWRLFDVGYNKVANIIYMMPEVLGDLPIPEHTLLTQEEEQAIEQQARAAASGKKSVTKKQ